MMFFGALMLLVLPLFLIVSAKMIREGDFGKTITGKILELIFYLMAAAGIATSVYMITLI
jgi:hypothetical protein